MGASDLIKEMQLVHILAFMKLAIFTVALLLIGLLGLASIYYNTSPLPMAQTAFVTTFGFALVAGGLFCAFLGVAVASSFMHGYLPIRTLYLASIYGPGRLRTRRSLLA
jgi:hypothetical protein